MLWGDAVSVQDVHDDNVSPIVVFENCVLERLSIYLQLYLYMMPDRIEKETLLLGGCRLDGGIVATPNATNMSESPQEVAKQARLVTDVEGFGDYAPRTIPSEESSARTRH